MSFINVVLLLVLSAAVFIIWEKNRNKDESLSTENEFPPTLPEDESNTPTLGDIQPGNMVTINRSYEEEEEEELLQLLVLERHSSLKGQEHEWELVTDYNDERILLRFNQRDELWLSVETPEFEDLGVEMEELGEFDRNRSGSFQYNDFEYEYIHSDLGQFYHNDSPRNGENFDFMEFKTRDGNYLLTIERWPDHIVKVICFENITGQLVKVEPKLTVH